jgi:hypothetical protein
MRQKFFTTVAALSFVISLAMIALWVRSYWHLDAVDVFPSPQHFWSFMSARGRVEVQQTWASAPYWTGRSTEFTSGELAQLGYSMGPFRWQIAGFGYGTFVVPSRSSATLTAHAYLVPHASLVFVFAALPAMWLRGVLRRRVRSARLAAGQCGGCGYDLRASSGTCPECGALASRRGAHVTSSASTDSAPRRSL